MPRDQLLLIPGTSGTKLLLDGEDFGWPAELAIKSWMLTAPVLSQLTHAMGLRAQDIVRALSMDFSDPRSCFATKSTLKPGSHMTPGRVLSVPYTQHRDFQHFTYDWRGDIRGSGEKLLRFLRNRKPAQGRWRIIAHSQGGLVAVVASKLAAAAAGSDDRAFSKLVSRLLLLAVPLAGTQEATKALVDADSLGAGFAPHFRKIAATWPALYQMLPVWRGSVLVPGAKAELVSARYPVMNLKAWEHLKISEENMERARATRRDFFRSPLAKMNGVKVRIAILPSRRRGTTANTNMTFRRPVRLSAACRLRGTVTSSHGVTIQVRAGAVASPGATESASFKRRAKSTGPCGLTTPLSTLWSPFPCSMGGARMVAPPSASATIFRARSKASKLRRTRTVYGATPTFLGGIGTLVFRARP